MATTQEIIDGATCFDCQLPPGFQSSALLYLFSRIAGVTDIQTIIDGATCIQCKIPPGLQGAALIYLADSIITNGSGGLSGAGHPEGVVTANTGTTYWATGDGTFWVKDSGTGNTGWVQLL